MSSNLVIFDRHLLAKRKISNISSLCKADFLIKRSFQEILERLNNMQRDFLSTLNLGSRLSYGSQELSSRKGTKYLIETDISPSPSSFKKIIADDESLPFADNKFDLIVSVLNLHLINDLPNCLYQIKNMLKPNGVFIASMFGETNLAELRSTLIKTELECNGGVSPRTIPYVDIKQLGMLLQKTGFNAPVIDKDQIKAQYHHPLKLIEDLRNMAETNILLNRNKNYVGKVFWKKFSENYTKDYDNLASFEILNLMATK
jgi:NADH dehydrogenase [ubiquinone] 1 alpha subcomplex assembly factor 5